MTVTKTCKCGEPSDGWPGEGKDEELCQMCWEKYCDERFWLEMTGQV